MEAVMTIMLKWFNYELLRLVDRILLSHTEVLEKPSQKH